MKTYPLSGEGGICSEAPCESLATKFVSWDPWEAGPPAHAHRDAEIAFIWDCGAMVDGRGYCGQHGPKS